MHIYLKEKPLILPEWQIFTCQAGLPEVWLTIIGIWIGSLIQGVYLSCDKSLR